MHKVCTVTIIRLMEMLLHSVWDVHS